MKKQIHSISLAIAASTSMGFAQSPATPPSLPDTPIQVKRLPARQSIELPELLQNYDFGGQL